MDWFSFLGYNALVPSIFFLLNNYDSEISCVGIYLHLRESTANLTRAYEA